MRRNAKPAKAPAPFKPIKKTGSTTTAKPVAKTNSGSSSRVTAPKKISAGKFSDYCDPKTNLIQEGK